jgi:hypothetical protein
MAIADPAGERSEIRDPGELLIFENQVIVPEALKFCESHFEVRAPAGKKDDLPQG